MADATEITMFTTK